MRPKIVCLIGSTRFYRVFMRAAFECEKAGEITVGPAFTPDVVDDAHGGMVGITPEEKVAIDNAFIAKIEMADEVYVINMGGYVGESTRRDLANARQMGKPVRWLEPEHALQHDGAMTEAQVKDAADAVIQARDLCGDERQALREWCADNELPYSNEVHTAVTAAVEKRWSESQRATGVTALSADARQQALGDLERGS